MTDDQENRNFDKKDVNMVEGEAESVGIIRPEMVDMARRFMMIPKIRQTSLVQQKRFLLQKGLREDEINEAMKGLPLQQDMWHINNTAMGHAITSGSSYFSTGSSGISTLLGLAKYAMIITGFSYASWQLLRSYVLPRFFNVSQPVEKRIHVIEEKIDEMEGIIRDVTTELLLKLQILIDKQSVTDRISFQSGISSSKLDDIQQSVENISAMLVSKEKSSPFRALARNRAAVASRVLIRTEDGSGSGNSDNERLEDAFVPVRTSALAKEHGSSAQAEKNDSGSDS
ncbi:hypothetical protein LOAG_09944 [Loa loa]|uniref:Peroxisomal membrane protein PEX14 n=1 Tax=Loa loa TaxID=7209 RepID=A0A1I7W4Q4_LOALO|nr:hypothetical protein LOAG_09944 [Loa loa]EFO18550.2 hypothetical protein LOAG_09944 [Loa loa]